MPLIGTDRQFECAHPHELDAELLDLAGRTRGAEGVLLPHDVLVGSPAIGRPAQRELLGSAGLHFDKAQPNARKSLWLVEDESDALLTRLCCTPAWRIATQQCGLDWVRGILRRQLDAGQSI